MAGAEGLLQRVAEKQLLVGIAAAGAVAAGALGCYCCSSAKAAPEGKKKQKQFTSTKDDLLTQECSVPRLGFSVRYPTGWVWRQEAPTEGTCVFTFSPEEDPEATIMLVLESLPFDNVSLSTYAQQAKNNTSDQLSELGMELSEESAGSGFAQFTVNSREFAQWEISVTNREEDEVYMYHTWNCVCVYRRRGWGLLVSGRDEQFPERVEFAKSMTNSLKLN